MLEKKYLARGTERQKDGNHGRERNRCRETKFYVGEVPKERK